MEKKPKKKRLIMIAVIIALLAAILGTAFFFYGRANPDKVEVVKSLFVKEEEEFTLSLGQFTLNVREEKHYARLNLAVAYTDEKKMEQLKGKLPVMQDIVVLSLFNVSKDEFLMLENLSEQKELLAKNINEKLGEEIVKAVYITELKIGR